MRAFLVSTIADPGVFKKKLIKLGSEFKDFSFLDSNSHSDTYDLIAGFDSVSSFGKKSFPGGKERFQPEEDMDHFAALENYQTITNDWIFGHFSYDLKNQIENLSSANPDGIGFPEMYFFQPKYLFLLKGNELSLGYLKDLATERDAKEMLNLLTDQKEIRNKDANNPEGIGRTEIKSRLTKSEYIKTVNKIKQHISRGDIYELNFCMEFFVEHLEIDPVQMFIKLNEISMAPFSAFYKSDEKYLFSASPERFLKKTGPRLLSQPVKGTIRRGENKAEDIQLREELFMNEKERNENVMIVDLVRNDLSRSAARGSVKVEELYGIHTFKQVHQMVSSVSAALKPGISGIDALKNAFPMGSMTGTPKVKAMELIEQYELVKRGLYSGAIGYISPEDNFDFNVVIRSIQYNGLKNYLSFIVGSAITNQANAEQEYEECMLKAKAMIETIESC